MNATIEPSSAVREAMSSASAALEHARRIDGAIDRQAQELAAAEVEATKAAETLAGLEAELALAEPRAVKPLKAKVEQAIESADAAARVVKRCQHTGAALAARLLNAEAEVALEVIALQGAVHQHVSEIVDALSEELIQACSPVLETLRKAHSLQRVLGSNDLGLMLADVKIPNPAAFLHPIVDGAYVSVDGMRKNMLDVADDEELLIESCRVAAEPKNTLAALVAYTPRAKRQQQEQQHYLKRSYVVSTGHASPPVKTAPAPVRPPSAWGPRRSTAQPPSAPAEMNSSMSVFADPDLAQFGPAPMREQQA